VHVDENAYWEGIAAIRRKLQRVDKKRVLCIDQTGVKESLRSLYSLAPSNTPARIRIRKSASYSPRFDVCGAILGDRTLPAEVLTPAYRKEHGVGGYTKPLLLEFLEQKVAPQLVELDRQGMIVCLDKGLAPTQQEVRDALAAGGYTAVEEVILYPTDTGKHLNPLDNTLWRPFKDRIRQAAPTTEQEVLTAIDNSWSAVTAEEISNHYHKCALYPGQDPFTERP
jgi:hypothetical protein